jgi:hypothetical protein
LRRGWSILRLLRHLRLLLGSQLLILCLQVGDLLVLLLLRRRILGARFARVMRHTTHDRSGHQRSAYSSSHEHHSSPSAARAACTSLAFARGETPFVSLFSSLLRCCASSQLGVLGHVRVQVVVEVGMQFVRKTPFRPQG